MKYLKKIISGAFIGVGIGFTLNLIFSFLNGEYYPGIPSFLNQYDSMLIAITVQTLIYMSLGIIQSFSTDIMNNQKRSLLSNTIIHFSIIFLPLLIVAYILHWGRDLLGLLVIGFSILVVYFIIWVVSYLSIKSQIDKINQTISKKDK
ncbi:DUF3021 domain-containing protein [Tetragenococcus koreensis]|uniref:DUF3021 domain-containing protein n=1 Tax=Tetragenococcus koreensis TaxID=290335 RepID=A0AAN4UE12_9ENTE|nr:MULTISPECIES: DUF3021 domain-containing protein [Enterococcaceae]MDN6569254.1 DUF3021 domain-containing protein [Tetragenococcus halophilus]AYW46888.1 DUF3021 domain-containing protein [Tetragenococcus koreensis]MCF1586212.1 DUF3021 domain-containing protein [Tetragenococcus koreensis]MCF1615801.1 DUF3021 domain-containing protein [Tetragenococcus koreensis]MCF1618422.1 DUF3021 domain-containing protein [Tetragenococcus koreensis]